MRWIDGAGERDAERGSVMRMIVVTSAFAAVLSAAAGCGCAREQGTPSQSAVPASAARPAEPATGTSAALPSPADAGAPGEDAGDAGSTAADPPRKRAGELARFYTALDDLSAGTRKDHVRVLWLGDSHGQADFWSGKLRSILQKRFGNGGPGFVHIAYKGYRHDGVEIVMSAKDRWSTTPKGPAASKKTGDGVFGLGGLLTSTTSAGADAAVEVRDSALTGKLHWDLCYRFSNAGDEITVSLTGKKPITLSAGPKLSGQGPLQHMKLTTDTGVQPAGGAKDEAGSGAKDAKKKGPRLTVSPTSGRPSFCGVVVESDPAESPGVVLDVLGINGARYTTALAWNEEAWLAEFMRRSPELVIFEYGTNETGDVGIGVEVYKEKVARLVGRVRKKKADIDCAVLAPTERADQEERSARMRDVLRDAAKENGCFFWDTIAAMGGKGAMRAWRDENPPKGARDGIHLTVKGYYDLGEKLAADLLEKY